MWQLVAWCTTSWRGTNGVLGGIIITVAFIFFMVCIRICGSLSSIYAIVREPLCTQPLP